MFLDGVPTFSKVANGRLGHVEMHEGRDYRSPIVQLLADALSVVSMPSQAIIART
jgi:hypothetical protein